MKWDGNVVDGCTEDIEQWVDRPRREKHGEVRAGDPFRTTEDVIGAVVGKSEIQVGKTGRSWLEKNWIA